MKTPYRILRDLCLAGLCLAAVGCVSSTRTGSLVPEVVASTRTGQPVVVSTLGGSAYSPMGGPGVTNDAFRQALETSLTRSGLFKTIGRGGYQLEAIISNISQPAMGFNMTTEIEVSYNLRRGGSSVWSESVRSTHTTAMGEHFVGAERVRLSTEGAVRENIRQAIAAMSVALD